MKTTASYQSQLLNPTYGSVMKIKIIPYTQYIWQTISLVNWHIMHNLVWQTGKIEYALFITHMIISSVGVHEVLTMEAKFAKPPN